MPFNVIRRNMRSIFSKRAYDLKRYGFELDVEDEKEPSPVVPDSPLPSPTTTAVDSGAEYTKDVRAQVNHHSDAVTDVLCMNAQEFDPSDSEEDGSTSSASETDASDSSAESVLPPMRAARGLAAVVQTKPTSAMIDFKQLTRKGRDSTGCKLSSLELIEIIQCGSDGLYRVHGTAPIPPLVITI